MNYSFLTKTNAAAEIPTKPKRKKNNFSTWRGGESVNVPETLQLLESLFCLLLFVLFCRVTRDPLGMFRRFIFHFLNHSVSFLFCLEQLGARRKKFFRSDERI
ncbi:hypothetical protein CEXT_737901 [Caerostris extrusa]|uniref:Uncharacterized protein n=1 Tax=Caerostris extrusa TaxID=172846 RepID=A0AAV4XXP1_CAEEX|nr:hypothetical protein CEXT_737901 [Caerostris extrusa]